jgi:hypothetical protein
MEQTTKKDVACTINRLEVELLFANGKRIVVDGRELGSPILERATAHGLKQKLVDAAAISRNPDTGATANIEDKYNAVYEVYQRLLKGEWNKNREGGGGTVGGLLFRALCQLYERKTPEQIREFLDGKTKSEQAALRINPKIAAIINAIQAERVSDVDSDDLLDELEA